MKEITDKSESKKMEVSRFTVPFELSGVKLTLVADYANTGCDAAAATKCCPRVDTSKLNLCAHSAYQKESPPGNLVIAGVSRQPE